METVAENLQISPGSLLNSQINEKSEILSDDKSSDQIHEINKIQS